MSAPLPNPDESPQHESGTASPRPDRPSSTLRGFGIPAVGSLLPVLVMAWFSHSHSNDYGLAVLVGFFGGLLGLGYAVLLVRLFLAAEKKRRGTMAIVYLVSWLWWMSSFGMLLLAGIASMGA